MRPIGALVLAFLALPVAATRARADEIRSDEGVAVQAPEGWQRTTKKLNATTALALERGGAAEPRPRIVINTLSIQNVTEDRAFAIVRESLDRPGEVVERPTGRFLKIDFDYDGGAGKLKDRVYTALRNKRVYCVMLETLATRFDEDARDLDKVIDGIAFFVPEPKKPEPKKPDAPAPAPSAVPAPPSTAPVTSPTEAVSRPADPKKTGDTALASATESDTPVPATEKVGSPKAEAAKPADAKPEAAKPEAAKPETAKPDAPKPVESKPAEPAPAPSPKPNLVRRAGTTNILGPASIVASDDEYDGGLWAAKHLVDPTAKYGWCSSPSGRSPHRFVLDLGQPLDVARVAFDDVVPADGAFEGAAAREVAVEGSTLGPDGPWTELGRVTLEAGKDDQTLDLAPNQGRWLRVSVFSNHGHPVLTQLQRIRAFAAEVVAQAPTPVVVKTDEGPFRLERVRLSLENRGPAVEPASFDAGHAFWIYFKPRALQLSPAGEYSLAVDLKFEDATGRESLARDKVVDHSGKPPAPPLSTFVSLKVELPASIPPGDYTLRIVAHDRVAGIDTQEKLAFEVKKPQ